MTRWKRLGILLFTDTILINLAAVGALFIRFERVSSLQLQQYVAVAAPLTVIHLLSSYFFGLYRRSWRYASVEEALAIVSAISVGTLASLVYNLFWFSTLPMRSLVIIHWFLHIALIGSSRFTWRLVARRIINQTAQVAQVDAKNILIVGAGDGGVLVARELKNHYGSNVRCVGFIDDDPAKQNQRILGYPVLGKKEDILGIVKDNAVDEIVIAMPSVPRKIIREIAVLTQQSGKKVKILPGVFDLIDGNVTVSEIREVQIEDLLGRDPVEADLAGMSAYITNRVVMVTGAGGSIGSELCRQILDFKPSTLLLLDSCENNMYEIEMELNQRGKVPLVALVKDVRDRKAIDAVFAHYKPVVVFHAAAHKHVPLMEKNPEEAIKTNVYGTFNVAFAAHQHKSEKFVLVSTDKAVNPTSVMGASKRIAEMMIQYLDSISETNYVAVRFGNVLGSRGSVIPLFQKQIMAGGPVTVTDEKMIRYFMTIPEAVQLILQTGALARGGEVFVLDMGDPVRILDLAETLIRLSGFQPHTDIDIVITGMRPGEKLFEELLTAEEGVNATTHERIFVARPTGLNLELLKHTASDFHRGYETLPHGQTRTIQFIQNFLPNFVVVTNEQAGLKEAAAAGED